MTKIDLVGQRFGRLLAIERIVGYKNSPGILLLIVFHVADGAMPPKWKEHWMNLKIG